MRKLLSVIVCLLAGVTMLMAQNRTITGTVISNEDGEPIIGASVRVTGTNIGTITDANGKFSLTVPASAKTLTFSYVGMENVEASIHNKMNIALHSSEEVLDDVLVVAYGTAKKSAFTGSAAVIDENSIAKIQASNPVDALKGKVAGVTITQASGKPGSTSQTIRVRGISSINAGNAPLIILDGSPYDGDMNNINPADIESMTILKDAASNALYGARGANGVIMITTKHAKVGDAKVTVDAKWGVNSRGNRRYDIITDKKGYYEAYYTALNNYALASGMDANAAWIWANQKLTSNESYGLGVNIYNIPEGQYLIGQNGKLNPNATEGRIVTYQGDEYLMQGDDWFDAAYGTGVRQEYNATVSNATEKSTFYASVGYLNNKGITDKSGYKRFAARLKADTQAKSWLKFGGNFSYTHYNAESSISSDNEGESGSSGNILAFANSVPSIYPIYMRNADGTVKYDANGLKRYDYGDGKNGGATRPFLGTTNAFDALNLDEDSYEGNAFSASGTAEVKFLKDFTFTTTNSMTLDETRSKDVTNPYYGQYASSNGILYVYHTRRVNYNFDQILNWHRIFDEKHDVQLMLGHESSRSMYYYLYGHKTNVFDPSNTELAGAITEGSSNSYTTDYNVEGYFTRAQYNYNEKYFASASFRRDASSRFHPDNRWGNFWSVGGAWLMHKENWFNVSWIDLLKVKASYGENGNDNIGNYRYTTTYNIVNSNGTPGAQPNILGNPDISWETVGNFNAGIEFEMFKSRLRGQVEFFTRKTTDMLYWFSLPVSFGYTGYYDNIGDMKNTGIEVELSGEIIRKRDFNWSVNLNLTHYKNKISYIAAENKTIDMEGHGGFVSGNYFIGEDLSLYTWRLKKYAGVADDGQSMWYMYELDDEGNKTGNVVTTKTYSEADYFLCDTSLPDLTGGFGTQLNWKGIDFSVDFAYQIGGKVYDWDYADLMGSPTASSRGTNIHSDLLNAWTPDNIDSSIPRFQFNDNYSNAASDRFLTDGSYLSLQNVTIGYTLPSKWTRKAQIGSVRFYCSADNVFLVSKRQGLDPSQSINGNINGSAYYAKMRTVSGGVNITF